MRYRLLTEFRNLFDGRPYYHRDSSRADFVAMQLYEDLVDLGRSEKLVHRETAGDWGLNAGNRRQGIQARRGDGTFGEIVPGESAIRDTGYQVARAPDATVEIGIEVKILAKAMIKQIDRVIGDLRKQVEQFRRGAGTPICVGIVGINHAPHCTSYEGTRAFATDGRANRHPIQEAAEAERRLVAQAAPAYDEFVILRYRATNEEPFAFEWVDATRTEQDYGAALVRISREYDRRF